MGPLEADPTEREERAQITGTSGSNSSSSGREVGFTWCSDADSKP